MQNFNQPLAGYFELISVSLILIKLKVDQIE